MFGLQITIYKFNFYTSIDHLTTTLSTDDSELTTALHHATVDENGQVVVQVPAHYEIGPNNTIIR